MPSRRELTIILCLALMDALAGFALLAGIGVVSLPPLRAAIIWPLIYAAWCGAGIGLAIEGTGLSGQRARAATLGAALILCGVPSLLLLPSIPTTALAAILLAAFYWRGVRAANSDIDYLDVQWRFGTGLAVFLLGIILLVARGQTEESGLWLALSLAGIVYTVTALAALGAARVESEREGSAGQAVFLAIAAQIVVIVLLSLGALAFFSFDVAGWIGAVLAPVWNALTLVIAIALAALASPFLFLAQQVHLSNPARRHTTGRFRAPHPPQASHHAPASPLGHQWLVAAEIAVVALIVLLVTLLIWRASARRQKGARRSTGTEKRESLLSPRGAFRALLVWLRGLFAGSVETTGGAVARARRRVLGPSYPSDPIRRVYAQVLVRAARHGLERSPTVTPAEFQHALENRWPSGASDFAAVTAAYMQRRYGDRLLSDEDVRTVQRHWHRLREVMRAES